MASEKMGSCFFLLMHLLFTIQLIYLHLPLIFEHWLLFKHHLSFSLSLSLSLSQRINIQSHTNINTYVNTEIDKVVACGVRQNSFLFTHSIFKQKSKRLCDLRRCNLPLLNFLLFIHFAAFLSNTLWLLTLLRTTEEKGPVTKLIRYQGKGVNKHDVFVFVVVKFLFLFFVKQNLIIC